MDPQEFKATIVDCFKDRVHIEESIIDFWLQAYDVYMAMWMLTANQGYLPMHSADCDKHVVPNSQAFPNACREAFTDVSGETEQWRVDIHNARVEECMLLAAAAQAEIGGKNKNIGFYKELFRLTLLEHDVPAASVSGEGTILFAKINALKALEGKGKKKKRTTLFKTLLKKIRNRAKHYCTAMLNNVQQFFQQKYCIARQGDSECSVVGVKKYDSAVRPGERLWDNGSSFQSQMNSSTRLSKLSISQRFLLTGDLTSDAKWEAPFDIRTWTAKLLPETEQPMWHYLSVERVSDVEWHREMCKSDGNVCISPDATPNMIVLDTTFRAPYGLDYFALLYFVQSTHAGMHQLVWSPLQEGIERLHASGLAASDTDFSISVLQIAESVCETMVKATFRGAYQGLEQSLEHGCLKMEFMPERVKDFANTHADAQVDKKCMVYLLGPSGLALLDAMVASLTKVTEQGHADIKLEFPHGSHNMSRFLSERTQYHKKTSNREYFKAGLKRFLEQQLIESMDRPPPSDRGGKGARKGGKLSIVKKEVSASGIDDAGCSSSSFQGKERAHSAGIGGKGSGASQFDYAGSGSPRALSSKGKERADLSVIGGKGRGLTLFDNAGGDRSMAHARQGQARAESSDIRDPGRKGKERAESSDFRDKGRGEAETKAYVASRMKEFDFISENKYHSVEVKKVLKDKRLSLDSLKCQCPEGSLCNDDGCSNRAVNQECCAQLCSPRCTNLGGSALSHKLPSVYVWRSDIQDLGLFAAEAVGAGREIECYAGKVVTKNDMVKLEKQRGPLAMKYTIELKHDTIPLYLDAYECGNLTRFINHSCDYNTLFQHWKRNGIPVIKVVSTRPISKGEELTIDYGDAFFESGMQCVCGAVNCRHGELAAQGVQMQITRGYGDSATEYRFQAPGAVSFELS